LDRAVSRWLETRGRRGLGQRLQIEEHLGQPLAEGRIGQEVLDDLLPIRDHSRIRGEIGQGLPHQALAVVAPGRAPLTGGQGSDELRQLEVSRRVGRQGRGGT
jgi:hypothetical protein